MAQTFRSAASQGLRNDNKTQLGVIFSDIATELDAIDARLPDGDIPAGSDTQIQYNNNGDFGASADLTWDDTAKELAVGSGTYSTTLQLVTPTADRNIYFPDASGTTALVAGASGQVTYNSGGAQAGDANFIWDATTGLALGKPLSINPGASVTPVDNGDVVFELTNNTTLTIKAKGSDGVVRSVALTLT